MKKIIKDQRDGKKITRNRNESSTKNLDTSVQSFDRYGWDILAVFLFALALISFLGLVGVTEGSLITPWITLLKKGFGWGVWLVILFLALMGFVALKHRHVRIPGISIGKVIALEGLAFALLALLAVFSGMSLEAADQGRYGGVIGWGLAMVILKVLPGVLGTIFLLLIAVGFAAYGFGFSKKITEKLGQQIPQSNTLSPDIPEPIKNARPAAEKVGIKYQPPRVITSVPKPLPPIREQDKNSVRKVLSRDDRLPPLNLLKNEQISQPDKDEIRMTAGKIEQCLFEFGVPAKVVGYRVGPTVTQFAVEPGFIEKTGVEKESIQQKVRVSQISNLSKDLALALSAERLRIQAPVPGHSYVGIEVPNQLHSVVRLRAILESDAFIKLASPLALALGRDVSGSPVVADLAKMPHLLIAGTTGSGKSVCIAAITTCLAVNNGPSDLKMAMLDPKMVELVRFNGLPHLLGKVETDPQRMIAILQWILAEMDNRYRLMENEHARDLESYNRKMHRKSQPTLPRIVVLIDELADLMMSNPDQTEYSLVRLAQMSRATGIHLVLATQRPSTNVVTGLIKANFPARIAFTVASAVDSRVILDVNGAETLLGKGDMLFLNPESGTPLRAQGVIVTDQEIDKVIGYWQKMSPVEEETAPWEEMIGVHQEKSSSDDLIEQAIDIVRHARHASASLLQRRMRIGYPRAARLIDELEEMGIVGRAKVGGKERDVLIPPEDDSESGVQE